MEQPNNYPKNVVLILAGAFSPLHLGHIKALDDAKAYCQSLGINVVDMIISPNNQSYLKDKLSDNAMKLEERKKYFDAISKMRPDIKIDTYAIDNDQGSHINRNQVSEHIKSLYPNAEPVIVGGEDTVTPGLNRRGNFWALGVNRPKGYSSTAIRNKKNKDPLPYEIQVSNDHSKVFIKVAKSDIEGNKLNLNISKENAKQMKIAVKEILSSYNSYGGVIVNNKGQVLIVEPTNHFDDTVWTFPKGRANQNEDPESAALREVKEETGYSCKIIQKIPGEYKGSTSITSYYLMQLASEEKEDHDEAEISGYNWVSIEDAQKYLSMTGKKSAKERDLDVLSKVAPYCKSIASKSSKTNKENTVEKSTSTSSEFPASINDLQLVKNLGGSTGALLVKDKNTGVLYVQKKGAHSDHIKNEFQIENYMRSLGVKVPPSKMYQTTKGPVKLSLFIQGKPLSQISDRKEVMTKIRNNFLANALVANWDIIGLEEDNVIIDNNGEVWFVDLGGSGPWRAMGKPKEKQWNDEVSELDTLPKFQPNYFGGFTHDELANQFKSIDKNHEVALNSIEDESLKQRLQNRHKKLKDKYTGNKLTTSSVVVPYIERMAAIDLSKFEDNSSDWKWNDLTPEEQNKLYEYTSKSYGDKVFDRRNFEKRVKGVGTPWNFFGDKDRTGYVSVKPVNIYNMQIYKLTGISGSKKGIFSGLAKLSKNNTPLFGAVTPDIYEMALKIGFTSLSIDDLTWLIKIAPEKIWGYNGKPSVSKDGLLSLTYEGQGVVGKKFICNKEFATMFQQLKSMV